MGQRLGNHRVGRLVGVVRVSCNPQRKAQRAKFLLRQPAVESGQRSDCRSRGQRGEPATQRHHVDKCFCRWLLHKGHAHHGGASGNSRGRQSTRECAHSRPPPGDHSNLVEGDALHIVGVEDDASDIGRFPGVARRQQAFHLAGAADTGGMSLRTGSCGANSFRDRLDGGANAGTVAIHRRQNPGRHAPHALQVKQSTGFTSSESSPGHIGLRGHRDPHPRESQSVEELQSGKRQVVSVIHRNVHEPSKSFG